MIGILIMLTLGLVIAAAVFARARKATRIPTVLRVVSPITWVLP